MSLVDLEKKVGVVLEKRGMLRPPPTRVGLGIDGSYSMKRLYHGGVVQTVVDRILAVASRFDDDGSLDAWLFDQESYRLTPATRGNYKAYVDVEILSKFKIDGGTHFRPVMQDILDFYFLEIKRPDSPVLPSKPGFFARLFGASEPTAVPVAPVVQDTPEAPKPAFAILIGDGENQDRPQTARLLREAAKNHEQPIYWQFVGIGDESFSFMRQMADDLPNVGFCEVRRLDQISDEDLYDRILTQEFIDWVRQ